MSEFPFSGEQYF